MKRIKALMTTALISSVLSMTAWAGEWKSDASGWWWQNDNGSYPVSQWKEINGKQYYFGADGYMLADTTTPDGYQVGADGAWIEGGVPAVPELTVTPYRDIPWDISWIAFSRDAMIDHGNYYELPDQTLYYTFYDARCGWDDYAEIYTGSVYVYKDAISEYPSFSSVDQALLLTEQHYNDIEYQRRSSYEKGQFHWMFGRDDMDEKGYFTKFYPGWAG